ncbi:LolA family protein [Flavisphingomonas formosensis]|uniref:LolA family protein n=1 Tax=Flavisphingomonas formosensis TaxID=861534 RepID=UPI0012F7B729|nr:outer membrane lipoprotein carrier protein LolA [Sphingomonas formosensis]
MPRFASFALIPLAAVMAPATAMAAENTLAQVSQHLLSVDTMTADFVQTDRMGTSIGGKLTLKRPGKIRFQYEQGVPRLIVGDGKALTMIDYKVGQVSRWPIGNSPLDVLLHPQKDMSRFARVLPSDGGDRRLLVQARDPKHPEYGTITLAFARNPSAPGGLMLQGWSVLDAQNNRTTLALSNQRFNAPVSDETFRWKDPRPQRPPNR